MRQVEELLSPRLASAQRTRDAGTLAEWHIPIVALTANAFSSEAEHCHAAGMDDYLSKPKLPVDAKPLKAQVGDNPVVILAFLHDVRTSTAKIAAELKAACNSGQTAQADALVTSLCLRRVRWARWR